MEKSDVRHEPSDNHPQSASDFYCLPYKIIQDLPIAKMPEELFELLAGNKNQHKKKERTERKEPMQLKHEIAMKMLSKIKPERFDSYDSWIKLVWMMKNIECSIEEIHLQCKRSKKYVHNYYENDTLKLLDDFAPDRAPTIGTLMKMTKEECSKQDYKELLKRFDKQPFWISALELTHHHMDLAQLAF